jgi:hypothetical protein
MAKQGDVSQIIPPSLLPRSTKDTPTLPANIVGSKTTTPEIEENKNKTKVGGGGSRSVTTSKQEQIEQVEQIGARALTAQERVQLKREIGMASLQKAQKTGISALSDAEIKQVAQDYYQKVSGIQSDSLIKINGRGYSVAPEKQEQFIEKKLNQNQAIIDKLKSKIDSGISTFSEERLHQAKTKEQENLKDKLRRVSPKAAEALTFAGMSLTSTGEGIAGLTIAGIRAPYTGYKVLKSIINPKTRGTVIENIKQQPKRVKQFFDRGLPEVSEILRTKSIGATAYVGTELATGFLTGAAISKLTKGDKIALNAEDIASTVTLKGDARQKLINKALQVDNIADDIAKASGVKDSSLATFRIRTKAGDIIDVVQVSRGVEEVNLLNGKKVIVPNQAETTVYAIKEEGKGIASIVGKAKTLSKGDEFFSEGQFVKLEPGYFRDKATLTTIFEKGKVIPGTSTLSNKKFLIESEAVIGDITKLKNRAAKKILELQNLYLNKNIAQKIKIDKIKELSRELTQIENKLLKFDKANFEKLARTKGAIESRTIIKEVLKDIRANKNRFESLRTFGKGMLGVSKTIKTDKLLLKRLPDKDIVRLSSILKRKDIKLTYTPENKLMVLKKKPKILTGSTSRVDIKTKLSGKGATRLKVYPKIIIKKKPFIKTKIKDILPKSKMYTKMVINNKRLQLQKLKKVVKPKLEQVKKSIISRPLTSQIVTAFSKGAEQSAFVPKARTFTLSKSIPAAFKEGITTDVQTVTPITKQQLTQQTIQGVKSEFNLKPKLESRLRESTITKTKQDTLLKLKPRQDFAQKSRFKQDVDFRQRFKFKSRFKIDTPLIKTPFIKLPLGRKLDKSKLTPTTPIKSKTKLTKSREKVKFKFERRLKLRSERAAKSPLNIVVGREFNPKRLSLLKSSLSKKFERRVAKAKELKKSKQIKSYTLIDRRQK